MGTGFRWGFLLWFPLAGFRWGLALFRVLISCAGRFDFSALSVRVERMKNS